MTRGGLTKYDDLPPAEAVRRAWIDPGSNPPWHRAAQGEVKQAMPLLARALERMAKEGES